MDTETNKNLLRDKTCDNCAFKAIKRGTTSWCGVSDYQPSKNTCKYWKSAKEERELENKMEDNYKNINTYYKKWKTRE